MPDPTLTSPISRTGRFMLPPAARPGSHPRFCRRPLLAALTLAATGALLTSSPAPAAQEKAPPRSKAAEPRPASEAPAVALPNFADIVERVGGSVVSITSTEIISPEKGGPSKPRTPFQDPFEFFFGPNRERRRFHQQEEEEDEGEERREDSGGSGFVVSADGYILTNYHVIEGASRITVRFNGRTEMPAEVVGTDPPTDLALIKVHSDKPLAPIPLGDSDSLRVGEWVVAIGNPLAYDHTVTVGVVSAKARKLPELSRDMALDSFIQTDAAINFGNSGGPLLNTRGEAVGINSAISRFGQGIGFAVPINMAKEVVAQLRSSGRVARGFLGINISEVTPEKQEYFGLKSTDGAFVESVTSGQPADKAGVRKGDVITSVDGQPVASNDELIRAVSRKVPGSKVRLHLIREGREMEVTAILADRAEGLTSSQGRKPGEAPHPEEGAPLDKALGLAIDDITPDLRRFYDLPADLDGALVTSVSQVGPAYEQGIREGDVITEVNRVKLGDAAQYREATGKVKPGDIVALYVISPRGGVSRFVTLRIPKE